jgi:hypothetical protein
MINVLSALDIIRKVPGAKDIIIYNPFNEYFGTKKDPKVTKNPQLYQTPKNVKNIEEL